VTDPLLSDDLEALDAATSRLVAVASTLDDAAMRAASLLPDWSVGHVLTHLARNADGMVNLVAWAESGVETPMYASIEARAADIETGSGRPAGEIARDVTESAARLRAALVRLVSGPDEAVDRLVLFGPPRPGTAADMPAWAVLYARLREVEIHHVDLGLASYTPADWPPGFVSRTLDFLDSRSTGADVTGHPAEVLAWRLGRGAGPSVRRTDGSPAGEPPAW
jgi:maleylpyruvate isomerase